MAELAAHINDPVTHTQAMNGLLAGLVVGALVGVALVATGGTAMALVTVAAGTFFGATAAGAGIGMVLGSLSVTATVVGEIVTGSPDVMWDGRNSARAHYGAGDFADCAGMPFLWFHLPGHGAKYIASGAATVLVNGQPAARHGDYLQCSGIIAVAEGTVLIGGPTVLTMELESEVPEWISYTLMAVGLTAALAVYSWVVVLGGLVGGLVGGYVGQEIAMWLCPNNEDARKIGGLIGSIVGGVFGFKAGVRLNNWLWNQSWFTSLPVNQGLSGSFMRSGGSGVESYFRTQSLLRNNLAGLDFRIPANSNGMQPDGAAWTRGPLAEAAAQADGYVTLNQTAGGRMVLELGSRVPWDVARPLWVEASIQYMTNVAGMHMPGGTFAGQPISVYHVGPQSAISTEGIYWKYERPIIEIHGLQPEYISVPGP